MNNINQKKNTEKSVKSKSLLRILFDEICLIKKNIKKTDITEPIKHTQIKHGNDYNFIPITFLNEIKNTIKSVYSWRFLIGVREYNIHIGLINENDKIAKQNALLIYMWLCFVDKFIDSNCSKKMDIYIYKTQLKKHLPDNSNKSVNLNIILGVENVNTAFTTSCKNNTEIHLFREEEWFKVLIHESMHCLGLDFSEMKGDKTYNNLLKQIFCIKTDFLLYEAYCEFYAEIISTMFYTIPYWSNFKKQIEIEQKFSVLQSCKILDFMNISYFELSCNSGNNTVKDKYKENSAIFSYYIIKSILIVFIDEFEEWIMLHNINPLKFNKTQNTIVSFCDFIKTYYLNNKYLNLIKSTEKKIKTANKNTAKYKSLQMTHANYI